MADNINNFTEATPAASTDCVQTSGTFNDTVFRTTIITKINTTNTNATGKVPLQERGYGRHQLTDVTADM